MGVDVAALYPSWLSGNRALRCFASLASLLAATALVVSTAGGPVPATAAAVQGGLPSGLNLRFVKIAQGFGDPVLVTHAGDGSRRLFIVEQIGRIRIIKDGAVRGTPFLDIQGRLVFGGEQ